MGNAGNRDRGPWATTCAICGERYTFTNRSMRRTTDGEQLDQHEVGCRRRRGETVTLRSLTGRVTTLKPLAARIPLDGGRQ